MKSLKIFMPRLFTPLTLFTYCVLLLNFVHLVVNGQYVSNNKRTADVYFQHKEYFAAAEYYKKALNITPDSSGVVLPYGSEVKIKEEDPKRADYEYCLFQLASSLRLYNDFKNGETWYAVAKNFKDPKYALASFYYGECLRANQKFTEAIIAFQEFQKNHYEEDNFAALAKLEIASCNFALYEMRYPRLYKFSKLMNQINDKGSNYTPIVSNANFYFTSSRPVAVGNKTITLQSEKSKVSQKETPYLNAIYEAAGNPQQGTTVVKKIGSLEKGREYAAPAFHPNGEVMYLTSWTAKGTRKIYEVDISKGTGNSWPAPKELGTEVNVTGFNSMQPFVTKDGKYLLFSSDRPGGFGKYDIWYCSLRDDGTVGQAVNMGSKINTEENEEAAYYNYNTKKLLYSSAGKVGLGGLDFYESEGAFSNWTEPRNLGYPFNSSKDDVYFTPLDEDDEEGFISSDRESLCCLEIFHVQKEFIIVQGTLTNCKTKLPLAGALVVLSDSTQKMQMLTSADGKYKFKINSNREIKLSAEKENYFKKVLSYNYDQLAKMDTLVNTDFCLTPFKLNIPIVLKNVLYDFGSADLTEASKAIIDELYKIMEDNETMEIELSAHTDNIGSEEYNLDLSDKRAESCVNYLISKGIAPGRMKSKGYGFSMPIAPNQHRDKSDNPEGRQLNRRTAFKVTRK